MADLLNDHESKMVLESNRLQSFGKKWPFVEEHCACNPRKLAQAGFFYASSRQCPDNVKCFVCFKELEGWAPEDDPWQEHKAHNEKCEFVLLGKQESQLTVGDMVNLLRHRRVNLARELVKQNTEKFKTETEKVKQGLLASLKTKADK